MSLLPTSWGFATVYGQYLRIDGTPNRGTIEFSSQQTVRIVGDAGVQVLVVPKEFVAELDETGSFSIQLPVADAPDLEFKDWAYHVAENISSGRDFDIILRAADNPLNLVNATPVVPPPELVSVIAPKGEQGNKGDTGDVSPALETLAAAAGSSAAEANSAAVAAAAAAAAALVSQNAADASAGSAGADATTATNKAEEAVSAAATVAAGSATATNAASSATASAASAATDATHAGDSAAEAQAWALTAQTTVTGLLRYAGSWSASSGTFPANPGKGDFWKVSGAGVVGGVDLAVGDQIIYSGTGWDKIDNTEQVTSVAGRIGNVVISISDLAGLRGELDAKAASTNPTLTGTVTLPSSQGTMTFAAGTGDGASYAVYNTRIHLHWGLAFADYADTINGVYDARAGRWDTKGGYRVNGQDVWHAGNFNPATKADTASPSFSGVSTFTQGSTVYNWGTYQQVWANNGGWVRIPRIFVGGTDPGIAAGDNDLWVS